MDLDPLQREVAELREEIRSMKKEDAKDVINDFKKEIMGQIR